MNKKVLIGIGLAVVIGLFVYAGISNGSGKNGKQVEAKVTEVKADKVTSSITASGMIEEENKIEAYLDTPVRVENVLIEKNSPVKKGDPIAVFNLDALQSEVDRLDNSRATQELTLKKLRLMQDPKGTASMEASRTVAQNSVKSAETAMKNAERDYLKNKELYAADSISKSELDRSERAWKDSQSSYENAKANLNSAQASLDETRKGNSQSTSSTDIDIQIQELNLAATEKSLADAVKKLEQAKAAMLAPMDGILSESSLKNGVYAGGAAQSLYAVSDVGSLRVRANVKEYDIRKVAAGQKVEFYGDAFEREEGVIGRISSVGASAFKPAGTTGDNVVEVLVDITKTIPVLRPGLSTTCIMFTEEKTGVPVIPLEAIAEDKDGDKYVFVMEEPAKTMKQVFIKLGIFSETAVEVTGGLKVGDKVILDPQPTYRDGVKVKAEMVETSSTPSASDSAAPSSSESEPESPSASADEAAK